MTNDPRPRCAEVLPERAADERRPARREARRGSERLLDKRGHLAVVDLGSCGHASLPSSLRAAYSGWRRARRGGEVLQGTVYAVLVSLPRRSEVVGSGRVGVATG